MAIKPILFNTEMVRAILDGRKSCTRRLLKGAIPFEGKAKYWNILKKEGWSGPICVEHLIKQCSPYQPGDILYVRETWCDDRQFTGEDTPGRYFYKASEGDSFTTRWHPSIHMPKEVARIWLKVVDVRVERVQEITDDGCIAEGVYPSPCRKCNATFGCDTCPDEGYNEIDEFAELWNSTIKKPDLDRYGWNANPYVWVIEFERCEKPRKE